MEARTDGKQIAVLIAERDHWDVLWFLSPDRTAWAKGTKPQGTWRAMRPTTEAEGLTECLK